MLKAALEDCNFDLITAGSGKEGIEVLCERECAAILLDVHMPDMDGFETALWVRARGIHTPIIFITAIKQGQSYAMRGYEAGAVDFLFKPLNLNILRAKISVLVELFQRKREVEIKAVRNVESAERRYRDLVEGIPNGIVWTSIADNGVFNFVSSSAQKISGYPARDWSARRYFLIMISHPDDVETVGTAIGSLLAGAGHVDFEHRVIRADGTEMWMHTTIRTGEHRGDLEHRGLSFDITSLKKTEQSLRETIVIRDEFISIASHELKTPLTPLQLQIEGFQRLAKRGELHRMPPETVNRMLGVSAAQVDLLNRRVNQLLEISSIKAGKVTIEAREVDLAALVRKAVDLFEANPTIKREDWKLNLAEEVKGHVDPDRIEQVLVNLIDNAIKYGLGKPIEITLRENAGHAEVTVVDRGIGIPAEDQQRIFKRFERAVSPSNYSGMGLGLFISRQIADLHEGIISVESRPNEGSAFKLSLPLDLENVAGVQR